MNLRDTAKKVIVQASRQAPVPTLPVEPLQQSVLRITHVIGKYVEVNVGTGVYTPDGEFQAVPSLVQNLFFSNGEYNLLMADKPSWAPSKPEGTYRTEDIFPFMDYLEGLE